MVHEKSKTDATLGGHYLHKMGKFWFEIKQITNVWKVPKVLSGYLQRYSSFPVWNGKSGNSVPFTNDFPHLIS